jgi:D-alanyl-D-alanine carboxypeptidase/D-alanyl-D-alanine-endopeptidase (penicillin-binding protein 4)
VSSRAAKAAICAFALLAAPASAHALDAPGLAAALARQEAKLGPAAGAFVRDLGSGQTLFASRADLPLAPASNEKLLVTAAALLRLGPDATLPTTLVTAAQPVDGVVDGDVALVGGGDPYLHRADLAALAQEVAAAGITRISGDVLADDSLLDLRPGSYDSRWRYDSDLGAPLDALTVDRWRSSDPAIHAAAVLRAALHDAGVQVPGSVRRGRIPDAAVTLAAHASPPLSALIGDINEPSDNYAAELLLKVLGAKAGAAGTTFAGAAVVRSTLARLGVRATVYDGSGLSRADRVSPRSVETLLERVAARPEGEALAASLPVAGRTGTLAKRMRSTAARERCQAKTGTLIGVSALSGYCTTVGGARLAFSFLENRVCAVCAKRIEDRMVAALARYAPAR